MQPPRQKVCLSACVTTDYLHNCNQYRSILQLGIQELYALQRRTLVRTARTHFSCTQYSCSFQADVVVGLFFCTVPARVCAGGCSLAERPAERRDPSQHVPRGSSSDRQRKDVQSRSDNHVGVRAWMDRSARMDSACTSRTNEPPSVRHVGCHRGDGRGGATTSPQQLRSAPSRWQSTAAWHRSSQPHQAGGSRHVVALAS